MARWDIIASMPSDRLVAEQRFFDEHYRAEGTALNGFYELSVARREFSSRILRAGAGARVLEYGCGTGSYAFELAERGADVIGIDISQAAIEIADTRAAGRANLTFRLGDAEHLQFDDASFDLVCGTSILHHLDIARAIREVRRVLRPGGLGLFYEPIAYNPAANLYRLFTPGEHTPDEHPLRRSDLVTMQESFAAVGIRFFDFFSLGAIPFLRIPGGKGLLRILEGADRMAMSVPGLRWLGTTAILEMRA
jgi:SAM-dependent methyltransferase